MSSTAQELAELIRRDLGKLKQEISGFSSDESVWRVLPGITNSAGNLALHIEGNLREYVGRQLGGIAYRRERPLEFSTRGLPVAELVTRIAHLEETIPTLVASLDDARLDATYPEPVLGGEMTVRFFLIHLHGHLQYHTGQVNYLRRIISGLTPLR